MGLFDVFKNTGDPERDAAFNRGLIAAGLQLMQAKGHNIFPALGQAGAAGMQAADQTRAQQEAARDQALRRKMVGYQLSDAERQKQLAELPGRFYRAPSEPGIDATGGIETATEAPNNASGPGGFDLAGYYKALQGMSPLMAEQFKRAVTPEPAKPVTLGRDQRLVTPAGQEIVPAMPADAEEKDAFVRMMKTAGIDPASPQGRSLLQEYLKKQATHAPPVNIANYGSPLPITLPGGGEGYIQPPTRPGGPSQILTIPGTTTPAQKPVVPKEMTDAQAKANLFGTRAKESDAIIGKLAATGVNAPSLAQQVTGGEGLTGGIATALASPQQQQVDQAQRDFINAVLRRESGAVIAIPEMANARKQYFPMPGDSPEVIAQKARNRQVAIAGILAEVPEAKRGVSEVKRYNPVTGKIE